MKSTLITRIDAKLKDAATRTAEEMGVPLSLVVSANLRKFVEDKRLTISAPYKMTPYLEKLTARVRKDIKAGKNIVGPFKTTAEMMEYLES